MSSKKVTITFRKRKQRHYNLYKPCYTFKKMIISFKIAVQFIVKRSTIRID